MSLKWQAVLAKERESRWVYKASAQLHGHYQYKNRPFGGEGTNPEEHWLIDSSSVIPDNI